MAPCAQTPGILDDAPLVTGDEAAEAVSRIHSLRREWVSRHPGYPIFTLGAAAYLDGPNLGYAGYLELARRTNPFMHEAFGWLHERLRARVSAIVGADATYDDRTALPGFHIYLSDPSRPQPVASVHYDMQYEQVDWTGWGTPDRRAQLSLTVSLALPSSGGGLLVWNINRLDVEAMDPDRRRAHSAANRVACYHAYTVGNLAVHSGHQLHQIASTKNIVAGDQRITMQAHALPVDGRWVIYW